MLALILTFEIPNLASTLCIRQNASLKCKYFYPTEKWGNIPESISLSLLVPTQQYLGMVMGIRWGISLDGVDHAQLPKCILAASRQEHLLNYELHDFPTSRAPNFIIGNGTTICSQPWLVFALIAGP